MNYYEILGISRHPSIEQIENAYTWLYVDYEDGVTWAEKTIHSVEEAYDVLSDPSQKAIYDNYLDNLELELTKARSYYGGLINNTEVKFKKIIVVLIFMTLIAIAYGAWNYHVNSLDKITLAKLEKNIAAKEKKIESIVSDKNDNYTALESAYLRVREERNFYKRSIAILLDGDTTFFHTYDCIKERDSIYGSFTSTSNALNRGYRQCPDCKYLDSSAD